MKKNVELSNSVLNITKNENGVIIIEVEYQLKDLNIIYKSVGKLKKDSD